MTKRKHKPRKNQAGQISRQSTQQATEHTENNQQSAQLPVGKRVQLVQHQHRSGPIPEAAELEKYESACPGAADRIIRMAEKEQENQHRIHSGDVDRLDMLAKGSVRIATIGAVGGLLIGILGVGCGTYLIATGKPISGFTQMIAVLATLVGVYLHAQKDPKK